MLKQETVQKGPVAYIHYCWTDLKNFTKVWDRYHALKLGNNQQLDFELCSLLMEKSVDLFHHSAYQQIGHSKLAEVLTIYNLARIRLD